MSLNRMNPRTGCTLIDFLVMVAVIVGLMVFLLPKFSSRRPNTRITCQNNLKWIGLAYRQWALDNNDKFPMHVSITNGGAMERVEAGDVYLNYLVMSNELNTPKVLFCPADFRRSAAPTFTQSVPLKASNSSAPFTSNNISYFVGLDADETNPQIILSGDDGFLVGGLRPKPGLLLLPPNSAVAWPKARHQSRGNVVLGDGSALGINTLPSLGTATNRLAMP